jgi:hypothetical protein
MTQIFYRHELRLLLACLFLFLLASFGPSIAQPANYHAFADQRSALGIPHFMDVLSNLMFVLMGLLGLYRLRQLPAGSIDRSQRQLSALFFYGLLIAAVCSAWYHWQPDDAGLAADRLGMTIGFAGLVGLAVVDRISARSGAFLAVVMLLLGPVSVWVWSGSGNFLPWSVYQGGAMLLLLVLAFLKPAADGMAISWGAVILIYALAKVLEQTDELLFHLTGQLISGHSLKHVVAALAAWPVISKLAQLGQNAKQKRRRHP